MRSRTARPAARRKAPIPVRPCPTLPRRRRPGRWPRRRRARSSRLRFRRGRARVRFGPRRARRRRRKRLGVLACAAGAGGRPRAAPAGDSAARPSGCPEESRPFRRPPRAPDAAGADGTDRLADGRSTQSGSPDFCKSGSGARIPSAQPRRRRLDAPSSRCPTTCPAETDREPGRRSAAGAASSPSGD